MKNSIKIALFYISFISIIFVTTGVFQKIFADEPYDPSNELLSAFGNQCSSTSDLTTAAIAQSNALKSVITNLRDDACKSLSPLVSSLETDLQAISAGQNNVELLTAQISDLQSAISVEEDRVKKYETQNANLPSGDNLLLSTFKTELVTKQKELLFAKQETNHAIKDKKSKAIKSFYDNSTTLLDQLAKNSACMEKFPNIVSQTGAQLLSLSGNLMNGFAGTALVATGGVFDHFVTFMKKSGINNDLAPIKVQTMKLALGCTLEGLATTYCKARDVNIIVAANGNFQKNDQPCANCRNTISLGADLLVNQLSAYNDFVSRLYAGSESSSKGTTDEKKMVLKLGSDLEGLIKTIQQFKNEGIKNYSLAEGDEAKKQVVNKLVEKISTSINENINRQTMKYIDGDNRMVDIDGPIGDAFSEDAECGAMTFIYTNGRQSKCKKQIGEGNRTASQCRDCIQNNYFSDRGALPALNIDNVDELSKQIIEKGRAYVKLQANKYNDNNPTLTLAMSEVFGKNFIRAIDFLTNASAYLKLLKADPNGIAKGLIGDSINETLARIDGAISTLNIAKGKNLKSEDTIKELKELLTSASGDISYIPASLSKIVKHDLDVKIKNGQIDKNFAELLNASASDSIAELINNYGNLEKVRSQVSDAKGITEENLNSVGKVFTDNIKTILESLREKAEKDSDHKDDLALFCIKTLLIPNSPDVDDYCKNTQYQSKYLKQPVTMNYDELSKKKYEERACVLYDFYRKNNLVRDIKRK